MLSQADLLVFSGASSGIGRATAVYFAELGAKLAITGRDGDELQKTQELCQGSNKSIPKVMCDDINPVDSKEMPLSSEDRKKIYRSVNGDYTFILATVHQRRSHK